MPTVDLDEIPGRWISSEVDCATMHCDTVNTEDKLRIAAWSRNGGVTATVAKAIQPPPRPVPRDELLKFTSQMSDWKAMLADPDTAEAMRRVRARVASLAAEGRALQTFAPVRPNAGSTLLNAKVPGPRHVQFRTSTLNPMDSNGIEHGWDPQIRMWTGRFINGAPPQPTSLWCSSWGASASLKSLDTEYKAVRPQDIAPAHYNTIKELGHSRGWR